MKRLLKNIIKKHNSNKFQKWLNNLGFGEIHSNDVLVKDFDYAFIENIKIKENVYIGSRCRF